MAWHLGHQFIKAGHSVIQVYNRSLLAGQELAEELDTESTNDLNDIALDGDIYIVAVSDHGIDDIILELRLAGKVVAHTSGAVPLKGMEHITEHAGIFYPLQTLTKENPVDFSNIPILIEANSELAKRELTALAHSISKNVQELDSRKRRALHVAAVFVNNFTNYLYDIADNIMEREEMDFSLLYPLMLETVQKLKKNRPGEVQTGPAKRGDFRTIGEHLNYLSRNSAYREVYLVLTESIMALYKEEEKEVGEEEPTSEHWDFGDGLHEHLEHDHPGETDEEDDL